MSQRKLIPAGALLLFGVTAALAAGATPVRHANLAAARRQFQHDALHFRFGFAPNCVGLPGLNGEEQKVFAFLSSEPKHIDAIMAESGTAPGKLSGLLTGLELKGIIRQLPGKHFVRTDSR